MCIVLTAAGSTRCSAVRLNEGSKGSTGAQALLRKSYKWMVQNSIGPKNELSLAKAAPMTDAAMAKILDAAKKKGD
jgi:hypothetical protein